MIGHFIVCLAKKKPFHRLRMCLRSRVDNKNVKKLKSRQDGGCSVFLLAIDYIVLISFEKNMVVIRCLLLV